MKSQTIFLVARVCVVSTLIYFSCDDEKEDYASCNANMFSICDGKSEGEYCTIGVLWGSNTAFSPVGPEMSGPGTGPVEISYAFVNDGFVFSTHAENDISSLSFDDALPCARQEIRNALTAWEAVTAVTFVEKADYRTTDVKIIVAEISQDGLGYPPFLSLPCHELAGLMIFKPKSNCESYYHSALHEAGHVLGLGHVASNNVMKPGHSYDELQPGDIKGIQSLYGLK
jgi:hypothetical protein